MKFEKRRRKQKFRPGAAGLASKKRERAIPQVLVCSICRSSHWRLLKREPDPLIIGLPRAEPQKTTDFGNRAEFELWRAERDAGVHDSENPQHSAENT